MPHSALEWAGILDYKSIAIFLSELNAEFSYGYFDFAIFCSMVYHLINVIL